MYMTVDVFNIILGLIGFGIQVLLKVERDKEMEKVSVQAPDSIPIGGQNPTFFELPKKFRPQHRYINL